MTTTNPEESTVPNPTPPPNHRPTSLPFSEMREHGLLWLINATVFHPRGYALAFDVQDDGSVTGWSMLGDGSEPWVYTMELTDEQFALVAAYFENLPPESPEALDA